MNRLVSLLNAFFVMLLLSSSAWSHAYKSEHVERSNDAKRDAKAPIERPEPLAVRVTGYGAFESKSDTVSESKRLMALRASKLDAYRAMAERIYGTGITGTSTVKDFVLKHDGFGVVVDSVVRGARVVSVTEKKGAGFETVLEVLIPGDFEDCLNKVNSFRHGSNCLRPLPQFNGYKSGKSEMPNKNSISKSYYLD